MDLTESNPFQTTVLGAMGRHKILVIGLVVLGALLGGAYGWHFPPQPTAKAAIVVIDPTSQGLLGVNGAGGSGSYTADQAAIIQLRSTAQAAVDTLKNTPAAGRLTADDIVNNETVSTSQDDNQIDISFKNPDPLLAQYGANALLKAYIAGVQTQAKRTAQQVVTNAQTVVDALEAEDTNATNKVADDTALATANTNLSNAKAQLAIVAGQTSGVQAQDTATLPPASGKGTAIKLAIVGLLLGLIIAAPIAYVLTARRQRFTDRLEPELVLERPLVAEVPDFRSERLPSDVPSFDWPDSASAEAFRFALNSAAFTPRRGAPLMLAITSSASSEGKTTVAANLAVTAALQGRRVLAIDADLEGQGLSWLLAGPDRATVGLVQVVEDTAQLQDAINRVTLGPGVELDVLGGGGATRNAVQLFGSAHFRQALKLIGRNYDLIIADIPAMPQMAYSSAIARAFGRVIVVVKHGSAVARLADLQKQLDFVGVAPVGYAYNRAPLRRELGYASRLVSDPQRRLGANAGPGDDAGFQLADSGEQLP